MAERNKTSAAKDIMDLVAQLPWWAGVACIFGAIVSFLQRCNGEQVLSPKWRRVLAGNAMRGFSSQIIGVGICFCAVTSLSAQPIVRTTSGQASEPASVDGRQLGDASSSWKKALHGKSAEAQDRIHFLCTQRAGQRIYGVVNDVDSISILLLDEYSGAGVNFSSMMSGLSATNLPYNYLRLGLRVIEFDARFASGNNEFAQPIAVFNAQTRDTSFSDRRRSPIELIYSSETTEADRDLGIYGQKISIRDTKTQKILAERIQFFWFHGSNPRTRIRGKESLCPGFSMAVQVQPNYFFSEVINPSSYPCKLNYDRDIGLAQEERKIKFREVQLNDKAALRNWSNEVRRREEDLLRTLNRCESEYLEIRREATPRITWIGDGELR